MTVEDGPEIVELDEKGNVIDIDEKRGKKGRGKVADDSNGAEYSAEFLAECEEFGIKQRAIDDGGDYRQDYTKLIYWLPIEDLLEFEKQDAKIEDNDEFWRWFGKFIISKGLQTKAEKTKKNQKSWKDWTPSYSYGDGWKQKASNWWNSYGGYSGYKGDSELTKKLAVALKAVTTTVQVVNDTGKRFRVTLASDDSALNPTSYTDLDGQQVVVSPTALLDTKIEADYGIEVTTGYGLHEASHVKYSQSVLDALTKPTKLTPLTVSSLFFNILEDMRIEALTGEKFPGFVEYFETALNYMWETAVKGHKPTVWGPELDDKLNSVIAMVKWPDDDKYGEVCEKDPELKAELAWWTDWWKGYVEERETLRMAILRGLEHLREDPKTSKEMDQREKEENKAGSTTTMSEKEFKDFLDKLRKELQKGVGDPCPSPSQPGSEIEVQLTAQQGQELEKLLQEQYSQEETSFVARPGAGAEAGPMIEVSRPLEDSSSKHSYRKPGPMVQRLRSVFFFRKKRASERERLLKQGFIDEDELWRAGAGDLRVFERTTQVEETLTDVTLLVDISGSMQGRGIQMAQTLANVMQACLRTQRGVRVRIRAHSTGYASSYGETCAIYRIWEQGDPDTRIGLLQTLPHGSNFDGFAIEWCLKELAREAQPDTQQVLIVLSDGLPSGAAPNIYYGGMEAMLHMRHVTDKAERNEGAFTIQIAIDPEGLEPEQQAIMFKHWIPYESDQQLLRGLTSLLSKIFGAVE